MSAEASKPIDVGSMSNAEIDAALKACGPIGVWAADWIARREHALHISDPAKAQAVELEELTLVIPGVPPSLNGFLRMHWKQRRRLALM